MGEGVSLQSRRALLKQFAPQYREASSAQKRVLLDTFAQVTGYHHRYGMWLLNHAEDVLHVPAYARPSQYGPDVQHALFLAWNTANRICAKRLIPFLPSLIDSLERHGHLQLTEEIRSQLLSMSAATADRLVGERAYRQLTELYRALRLYVNCFQPSMKLLSKQREGKKVRCVYDPARAPLQRLLLSGALPVEKQRELTEVAQALDPVSLLHQLELLQQAVFRRAVGCSPFVSSPLSDPLHVFSVEKCTAGNLPDERNALDPTAGLETLYREQERRKRILGWRCTHKDPFEGEWEQIFSWLQANPERSSGDIFRELQRRSPGRYQPLQIRTLQRGMKKIRAYLLETVEEQWQAEVIRGSSPAPISARCSAPPALTTAN